MAKGVKVTSEGESVHDAVFASLRDRLAEEVDGAQPAQKVMLAAVGQSVLDYLTSAHSVIYGRGLHSRLDLSKPLIAICWDALALLQQDTLALDGEVLAAQRIYESVVRLISLLITLNQDHRLLLQAAIAFGRAQVLMTDATSGLWGIMAEAGANAETAEKIIVARSAGGATTGKMMKAVAQEWKAAALSAALEIDAAHPKWTRSRIATELAHEFHGRRDLKLPGIRALEEWLEKEAEQPHGPLRSRARKSTSANAVS